MNTEKLNFTMHDKRLLKRLSDNDLYMLTYTLFTVANNAKRDIKMSMLNDTVIKCLVRLAEKAAKEVSNRLKYEPKPSNGIYVANGITYDTQELRDWFRTHRNVSVKLNQLSGFSFMNEIITLLD